MDTQLVDTIETGQGSGQERFTDSLKRISQDVFRQRHFSYSDHSFSESIGYGRNGIDPNEINIGYMTDDNLNKVYLTFKAPGIDKTFTQMTEALQDNLSIKIVAKSLNAKVKALIIDQDDTLSLSQTLTAFKNHVVEPGVS
ncbi:MAG: hypothetical protein DHS20C02_08130 [Micavibrio sp.]|nr:MAG: hypothetical protein DHS20C02_08130 [Micavibrio sp.]